MYKSQYASMLLERKVKVWIAVRVITRKLKTDENRYLH